MQCVLEREMGTRGGEWRTVVCGGTGAMGAVELNYCEIVINNQYLLSDQIVYCNV